MSWRLPPPVWIRSRSGSAGLATVLQCGAVAWRVAKWSVGAGLSLVLLRRFVGAIGSGWTAAAWVAAGTWLLLLWERYRLGEAASGARRVPRIAAAAAVALAAGAGTWAVAHLADALLAALSRAHP